MGRPFNAPESTVAYTSADERICGRIDMGMLRDLSNAVPKGERQHTRHNTIGKGTREEEGGEDKKDNERDGKKRNKGSGYNRKNATAKAQGSGQAPNTPHSALPRQ